ncbi:hypothetical protein QBA35_36510 [Streptomyces bottropensis]|uniref:Uncharacterized protein n=1 Tax=Streptomyces bottropensis TaxID=42235 RepID=A0ABU8AYK3_9ACTN
MATRTCASTTLSLSAGTLHPARSCPGTARSPTPASCARENRDFLAYIRDHVAELKAAGVPFEQAVQQLGEQAGTRWTTWDRGEFIGATVLAFYGSPEPSH